MYTYIYCCYSNYIFAKYIANNKVTEKHFKSEYNKYLYDIMSDTLLFYCSKSEIYYEFSKLFYYFIT